MRNPLEEYLAALEARDVREKAHEQYINAYTRLADRTAALSTPAAAPAVTPPDSSPTPSSKSIRPGISKGRIASAEVPPPPSSIAQIRAELASTQKTRSELETKLTTLTSELTAMKTTDAEQRKRIAHLEKVKENLERRVKDRAEELKGKGTFVDEVQNELVALDLQLNMAEKEKDRLKKENEELTRRLVKKMEEEATRVNESNDQWVGRRG